MNSLSIAPRLAAMLSALAFVLLAAAPPLLLAEEIPARLQWAERLEMGTPVSGIITRIDAEPGQRVRRGDVLVHMDDRAIRASLEEDEAQVRRLEIARAEAELEYERAQEMYDRTLISQRDLSVAEIEFAMADAQFVAARARLTRTRLDLEHSRVRAPFDALVLARHVGAGQMVNNELQVTPLVTIAADDAMLALGQVDERRLQELREGQDVEVQVGERRYPGTLGALGLEPVDGGADAARYRVTVRFTPPAEHGLRAGQQATLHPAP